jgi:hypothetical protein
MLVDRLLVDRAARTGGTGFGPAVADWPDREGATEAGVPATRGGAVGPVPLRFGGTTPER